MLFRVRERAPRLVAVIIFASSVIAFEERQKDLYGGGEVRWVRAREGLRRRCSRRNSSRCKGHGWCQTPGTNPGEQRSSAQSHTGCMHIEIEGVLKIQG
jgi:hypothetical protein